MENQTNQTEARSRETVYLITGASSAVATSFLRRLDSRCQSTGEGALAICHCNSSPQKLESLAGQLRRVKIFPERCDATDPVAAREFALRVAQSYPPVDNILHAAAARFSYTKLKDFSAQGLIHQMNVNVVFAATLASVFIPKMFKRKGSFCKIVFVLSQYVFGVPPKHMMEYVTVKHALLGLSKSLASDCAGRNVRVNAVSPSMMQTPFLSSVDPRIVEMTREASPTKSLLTCEQLAAAIEFLFSEGADRMNGANLNITCGAAM